MPDPQVPKTISRLLGSSFQGQVRALQRSLRTHPLRALDWLDYWKARPEDLAQQLPTLETNDRLVIQQLSDLYKVVTGNPPFVEQTRPQRRSVRELFDTLAELTLVVGEHHANALMVRGGGGTGKTWTVRETLTRKEIAFETLKGYSTPLALFNLLYQNRTKLIVVDDCDNIFSDVVGLNILKAVLDSYPVRTVCWNSTGSAPDVSSFNFEGQVIFISNMGLDKISSHMQAVLTRVLVLNMDLTSDQVLQQIGQIRKHSYKNSTEEERYRVYTFLKQHISEIPNINFRHYTKGMDLLLSGRNWRKLFMDLL